MFKWDGSNVTDIISKSDIYQGKYNDKIYWMIKYDNNKIIEEVICIIKSCKNTIPCLIDELKPVFGLPKLGTHWFIYKKKMKMLIKCVRTKKGYIKEEITLNKIEVCTRLLILQIQEIFTFRELLGVTCSYESSIIIRESKNSIYPISYYDPNMTIKDVKVIPFTVLNKWFKGTSIDNVVKRLLKIYKIDRIGEVLYNIRNKIEKIIERVDKRAISYKTCIINRITERLQTTLN